MDVTAKALDGGGSQEQKEQVEHSSKSSSSPSDQVKLQQPMSSKEEEDELETTKAEMSEVKQENERLRAALSQAIMDYNSLQTKFSGIIHKDQEKIATNTAPAKEEDEEEEDHRADQLVSLSLGASASSHDYNHKKKEKEREKEKNKVDVTLDGGLELGLNFGFDRQRTKVNQEEFDGHKDDGADEEMKEDVEEGEETEEEDEKKEGWASRKILKNTRGKGEDEDLHYNPVKKARVSVRARCDGVMMNDGCQWRKYGQKIAKGNPCPRSYYRCTVAPGCPVRKQVQRCAEDMSILTTTYEGKHNHPLPPAATAMVATTSAAMNMLLSGSSTSRPGIDPSTSTAVFSDNLNCLNFSLSDNLRARQYLSISPSHPTITIDLTSPESSTSQAMQMGSRFSTNFTSPGLRYLPTTFNYPSLESTPSAPTWSSGYRGYYGTQLHGSKSQFAPLNVGGQTQESFYRSSMQKLSSVAPSTTQHSLTDTISAATKAITSDPSFQSALAATVASVLGGKRNHDMGDTVSRIMERGEHLSSVLPYSSSWKGNLPNQQTSLAFSNHKSSSSPPVDKE